MYYFIINPKSKTGKGIKIWHKVQAKLDELHIPYKYYFTNYEFHSTKLAEKICQQYEGVKKIVVLGGDGTVNEVINGIRSYQDVMLGYIPTGSSNDLARSLHIPGDPLKALDLLLNGHHYVYYDHGQVSLNNENNSRKFAVSSGVGFDAVVCYEALNSNIKKILNKIKLGKLTYGILALKGIISYKPCDGELIIDGEQHIKLKKIFFAASMIQPYEGGGCMMAPQANASDGKLSVCVFNDIPKYKILFVLPLMYIGKHTIFKRYLHLFDCNSLEILLEKEQVLHTDGEYVGKSDHIFVRCVDEQVRMLL